MNNAEDRKKRYLQDDLPVRLGGIAANLARVGSFVSLEKGQAAVDGLLEESKFFIEWTAADFELHAAAELVDLQRKLIVWQKRLSTAWDDRPKRLGIGVEAKNIAEELIEKSGLTTE